jgi:hypothetical protein
MVTDGNSGTTAGTNFIGTTDTQPLEIDANAARVMRYEPAVTNSFNDLSPNMIGGDASNSIQAGAQGATIGGGGGILNGNLGLGNITSPNMVQGDFGTVAGGFNNLAGGVTSTVASGGFNNATGDGAAAAGGFKNAATAKFASIPGGQNNIANGICELCRGQLGQRPIRRRFHLE